MYLSSVLSSQYSQSCVLSCTRSAVLRRTLYDARHALRAFDCSRAPRPGTRPRRGAVDVLDATERLSVEDLGADVDPLRECCGVAPVDDHVGHVSVARSQACAVVLEAEAVLEIGALLVCRTLHLGRYLRVVL